CTLLTCGVLPSVQNESVRTPLSMAAEAGNVGAVKALLDKSYADINVKNMQHWTPLAIAAETGYLDIVAMLLDCDQVDVNTKDIEGRTSLWLAAWNGHASVIRALLGRNDIEAGNKDLNGYKTPLAIACWGGHIFVVQELLADKRVDVNSPDAEGLTPVHLAHLQITDPNTLSEDGWTPLDMAAFYGQLNIVRALINDGRVDINKIAGTGQTAITIAARRLWPRVVEELLQVQGVDLYKRGAEDGISFVNLMEVRDNQWMKELL
ncbi:ankyrin, partial [Tuber magnatum]